MIDGKRQSRLTTTKNKGRKIKTTTYIKKKTFTKFRLFLDFSTNFFKIAGLATPTLSEDEEESVAMFMSHVNTWRRARSFAPLSRESSVKFLMARKFAVDRAITLYRQHELMRLREKLISINPNESPLQDELVAGKFTVLTSRDAHGAALALFNAHLHDPGKQTAAKM